jgi:hypothetical protein
MQHGKKVYCCEICRVECGCFADYTKHLAGKKHKAKEERPTANLGKDAQNESGKLTWHSDMRDLCYFPMDTSKAGLSRGHATDGGPPHDGAAVPMLDHHVMVHMLDLQPRLTELFHTYLLHRTTPEITGNTPNCSTPTYCTALPISWAQPISPHWNIVPTY